MGFFELSSYSSKSSVTALKWLGFVAAIWVQAISGNNYTFSNYSDALKSLMNLTQLELNNLSVAKDVGKAFGLLAGFASDKLPTWVILLIGSVEGLVGYGAQWLVVSETIKPLSYWQMCIFLCMGGNSTTWMNTAVLVSGILKGYVGLSTAIFTDVCAALFSDDASSFLVMLAVVPFAVCLVAAVFLRESPPASTSSEEKEETQFFWVFNAVAVVVAVYLLAYDFIPSPSAVFSEAFSAILMVLLASPVGVPVYIYFKNRSRPGSDVEGQVGENTEPLLLAAAAEGEDKAEEVAAVAVVEEEVVEVVRGQPLIGEEHTIVEVLKTIDFWVLFVSFLCGVGTGLAVQNNMGQIGLALGYSDVSIFVSLISIWGFFGRNRLGKAGTPRPLWNAAAQILMVFGFVILALALPGSLYIGSILVGICYGIRIAISVPTASELFGLKYYGLIYNILILNLPLGSFLFSGLLAGILYDMEATPTAGGGNTCVGAHCYRTTFVVMAVACIIGFGLDILLSIRTKAIYTKIYASKKSKKSSAPSNGRRQILN
ncbi:hypothetical protein RGQ29_004955 [Quercus rubra]|uniref:Nodulin-like domain-containing protein n=1 Tax=Quercus rubra TaxID=3512 RepID=A0AAN7E3A1_QUERU|nr:hypothetical protein RGQ29_004955 [Quercus rubra]